MVSWTMSTMEMVMLLLSVLSVKEVVTLNAGNSTNRSKRFLYINPDASLTFAFLLNCPISSYLPTLVDLNRKGRTLDEYGDKVHLPGEEYPEELAWDSSYELEIGKLQLYFAYLKVSTVACQERLICELASSPTYFAPLSTLFLKQLRQIHGPVEPSNESLFWRYMAASATGYAYSEEDCGKFYNHCKTSAKEVLKMPVLKVWQYLATKINLKLI